jgi:regulator of sigma E protease
MDTFISVAQFFCALSLLVLLHEFGHFFFARLFKTRVDKFYLFFDFLFPLSNVLPFALWKKKKGDTEYGIGWFPLGGYVKIAGMVDESMDTDQLKSSPQPWEFRSKKAWQRLLIMLGGIIVNVLLSFLIYALVLFTWGEKKLPMSELKYGIEINDSMAYQLGFKDGDKIIAADNKPIIYFDNLMASVLLAREVQVNRNGKDTLIAIPVDLIGQLSDKRNIQPFFGIKIPTVVGDVVKDSKADEAGLLPLDKIIGINDIETPDFTSFRNALKQLSSQDVELAVIRNNQPIRLSVNVSDSGTIGFRAAYPKNVNEFEKLGFNLAVKEYGFFESFPAGVKLTGERLGLYIDQFKKFINPQTGAYKSIGGFASMTKLFGSTWDWEQFWNMTAFISIMLAFMNLLPIPGLDGGYVMFNLYEMITGRKPNDKFLEVATSIGLIFLLFFMLYANGMDLYRFLLRFFE